MNELPPEVHNSDEERDGAWCGMCGFSHGGDCPPDELFPEDDDEEEDEPAPRGSADWRQQKADHDGNYREDE